MGAYRCAMLNVDFLTRLVIPLYSTRGVFMPQELTHKLCTLTGNNKGIFLSFAASAKLPTYNYKNLTFHQMRLLSLPLCGHNGNS